MKTPNMSVWTKRLRDPELVQVNGTLARYDIDKGKVGFCCLGVGCVVAGIEPDKHLPYADDLDSDGNEHGEEDAEYYFENEKDLPPVWFHEWLGLDRAHDGADVQIDWPTGLETPYRTRTDEPMNWSCAQLNDGLHLTFSQIADVLDYFGVKG